MSLQIIKGNLFDSRSPALAHGCNCRGFQGAGIAAQFRKLWPGQYYFYKELCENGEFQLGDYCAWGKDPIIYNLATQFEPGPDARLWAVESSLGSAMEDVAEKGLDSISVPKIGCGIGGLDWQDVEPIVIRLSEETGVDIIVYEL